MERVQLGKRALQRKRNVGHRCIALCSTINCLRFANYRPDSHSFTSTTHAGLPGAFVQPSQNVICKTFMKTTDIDHELKQLRLVSLPCSQKHW